MSRTGCGRDAKSAMETGAAFGPWLLNARLGVGGMGEVWLATHRVLGRRIAVKILAPELTRDPRFRERFVSEAQIQARLSHPHIAQIQDFIEEDGRFAILMEWIPGGAVADAIERTHGPLSNEQAVKWAAQALEALDYAHRQGVIHRDVKPSNLMLDGAGDIKVTDFGIAVAMGVRRMTTTGRAVGTPHYMSPEQILRPQSVDARTDIYSMGVVMHKMLAGRVPFDADTDFTLQRLHIEAPPPPLRTLNPAVPEWLESVVLRCLAKSPDDRFADCAAVVEALHRPLPPVIQKPAAEPPVQRSRPELGSGSAARWSPPPFFAVAAMALIWWPARPKPSAASGNPRRRPRRPRCRRPRLSPRPPPRRRRTANRARSPGRSNSCRRATPGGHRILPARAGKRSLERPRAAGIEESHGRPGDRRRPVPETRASGRQGVVQGATVLAAGRLRGGHRILPARSGRRSEQHPGEKRIEAGHRARRPKPAYSGKSDVQVRGKLVSAIVLLALPALTEAQQAAPCPQSGPLSEAQLTALVKGSVPSARIEQFVAGCGIGFEPTGEAIGRLRSAGVPETLLEAIRGAAGQAERKRQAEQALWEFIKDSHDPQLFDQFLKDYPAGQHAEAARLKLAALKPAASATDPRAHACGGHEEGEPQGPAHLRLDSAGQVYHGLFAGRRGMRRRRETRAPGDHFEGLLAGPDARHPAGLSARHWSESEPFQGPRSSRRVCRLEPGEALLRRGGSRLPTEAEWSTPRARAPRARATATSMRLPGIRETAETPLTRRGKSWLTPTACTICWGTCGSGSRTL